jgi:hypothetical protein
MKRTAVSIILTVVALLVPAELSFASPTTFKNEGLKVETIVVLDVTGKAAKGTFRSHEYDADEGGGAGVPFTGKVVPTPKGKTGIYLEIQFAGTPPYNVPPKAKTLVWFLKIVKRRAHLFIPMEERSYEGDTPRWIVSDVELEPVEDD